MGTLRGGQGYREHTPAPVQRQGILPRKPGFPCDRLSPFSMDLLTRHPVRVLLNNMATELPESG